MYAETLNLNVKLSGLAKEVAGEVDKGGRAAEQRLNKRFSKIAGRFGKGLKQSLKFAATGGALGAIAGLLTKALNPVDELEKKLEELLQTSRPYEDVAAKLGTTVGQVRQIESVGASFGIPREEIRQMLEKYADAIHTARAELADPDEDKKLSPATEFLKQFADMENIADSFLLFQKSLRKMASEQGSVAAAMVPTPGGGTRTVSREEFSREVEREVFGERFDMRQLKFAGSDFETIVKDKSIPSIEQFNKALDRIGTNDILLSTLRAKNEDQSLFDLSNKNVTGAVRGMAKNERRVEENLLNKFDQIESLRRAQEDLNVITNLVDKIQTEVIKGISQLTKIATDGNLLKETVVGGWQTFKESVGSWFTSDKIDKKVNNSNQSIPTGARRGN